MLQRVQTIYLLLAAICGVLTLFLPYSQFFEGSTMLVEYAAFGVFNVQSDTLEMTSAVGFPIWVFGIIGTLLPLVILLLYKNRKLQLSLNRLSYLIYLSYAGLIYWGTKNVSEALYQNTQDVLFHVGFYLPVAAIVFSFLAARGIKKDEALVRSIDRIR